MLLCGHSSPQRRVRLRGRLLALLNERPKDGVVEVIDVRVGLSPRKVVSDRTGVGIYDDAAVKGRRVAERRVRKISGPVEHIARGKVGRER